MRVGAVYLAIISPGLSLLILDTPNIFDGG